MMLWGVSLLVEIEKAGEYLNGDFCKKNNVTKIKILTEPDFVDTEFGEKLQCMAECNDKAKSKRKWSINNTSRNSLIELYGKNTKLWIGKEIDLDLARTSTNTGMKDVIFVRN